MSHAAELALASRAAQAAAALLAESFATDAGVRTAAGKDIKTRADLAAEAVILRELAVSGLPIIAEESAVDSAVALTGPRWYVDPLDGTLNFARGFPMHAVSIALWEDDRPLLGAIYDIPRRALYRGVVGAGADCDGTPLHVSTVADCGQAVLATGFPTGRDYGASALEAFVRRVQSFKKIRMIGSAALSLAHVAAGTFDAYTEEDIMIWDVAAGLALVAAAGGRIETRPGSRPHAVHALATNANLTL